jgi:dihydroflavonol-4-reductase
MRVLVTGGTGFLGKYVVAALRAQADTVRVLTTERANLLPPDVEVVTGSITDPGAVQAAVEGVDGIYHLAGKVSRNSDDSQQMYQVHVEGTRRLCEAAKVAKVPRIVMASTSGTIAVTDNKDEIPDESWPPPLEIISRWPYYASKFYQEETALKTCGREVEVVILNPSLILGPGDDRLSSTNDILKFIAQDIALVPAGGLNFVDVRDCATAFVTAMLKGRPQERYLLGGPNWTFTQFFGRLERLTKVSAPKFSLPSALTRWGAKTTEVFYRHWGKASPVDPQAVEMAEYFWYLNCRKAQRELQFVSRDPGETLHDTVKYLREHFLPTAAFSNK